MYSPITVLAEPSSEPVHNGTNELPASGSNGPNALPVSSPKVGNRSTSETGAADLDAANRCGA
jgi:hypothetical protein